MELLPHQIKLTENLITFNRIIKKGTGVQYEWTVYQNRL